jgi:NADH:ubiquinone oxidoreductase subunit F (NADH-binding)
MKVRPSAAVGRPRVRVLVAWTCHRGGDRHHDGDRRAEHVLSTQQILPRLLAGPSLDGNPERLPAHLARLGALPRGHDPRDLISSLEASGLLGRGGAGFPVGRKWRALAERDRGRAVVVANGAEGEVASTKDRVLMAHRPHLVIDGAVLAAEAIGADEIVLYVGEEHEAAVAALRRALIERQGELPQAIRVVTAPISYVAGEASAAVHQINAGDARPTTTPPRVSERGVAGRPTLVQNVESLAYAALIARFGDSWYRSAGRGVSRGTALITVSGDVREDGVREIELGTTVGEVAAAAGAMPSRIQAVVLGGYFGTWARAGDAWDLPLDPAVMRSRGLTFGCGIVGLLAADRCGVAATAEIMAFMAGESAGQCGPCVFGLRAISDATSRVARGGVGDSDLDDIERWTSLVRGRGACHHPDGAAQLMASALDVFGDEFARHARTGRCSVSGTRLDVA